MAARFRAFQKATPPMNQPNAGRKRRNGKSELAAVIVKKTVAGKDRSCHLQFCSEAV